MTTEREPRPKPGVPVERKSIVTRVRIIRPIDKRLDALEREIAELDRALERRLERKTLLAVDTEELISARETWLHLDELEQGVRRRGAARTER
jgi:hypothetical protein